MPDNKGMSTYKVTLVYQSASRTWSSRSRYVSATSKAQAVEIARLALRLPAEAKATRITVE